MGLASRMGGLLGLEGLYFSLVAILIGLLYYYAYVRSGNWKSACVATGLVLPVAACAFSLNRNSLGTFF